MAVKVYKPEPLNLCFYKQDFNETMLKYIILPRAEAGEPGLGGDGECGAKLLGLLGANPHELK